MQPDLVSADTASALVHAIRSLLSTLSHILCSMSGIRWS